MRPCTLLLVGIALSAAAARAQSNAVPGMDAQLIQINQLRMQGRLGEFPGGKNGVTLGTTICNRGTVAIPWRAAMQPTHPFYGFLLCREQNGRFEQISDRTFVKHGFSSTNSNGCGVCQTPGSVTLGPNCSDVYSTSLNADRFHLGPADEIDPWLGAWQPVGSHFDRGEPNVGPPQNMDGQRSLTRAQVNAMNPVTHRIEVWDADLAAVGARFFYGAHAVIGGEPEAVRENNLMWRETVPEWRGNSWSFSDASPAVNGSILGAWTGASVAHAANGADDGRLYVGVLVTGPNSKGLWHYEYAVYNRDNSRGAASLRIPICSSARVLNARFRDIDADPLNDWTVSVTGSEVAFLAGAQNALEWNTLYNFSFDSDAEPLAGQVALDQARPGAGAAQVTVASSVPGRVYNVHLGGACGAPAPELSPAGSPPFAAIPNASFGLQLDDLAPGASAALFFSLVGGSTNFGGGCVLQIGVPPVVTVGLVASAVGTAAVGVPIPNEASLEGVSLYLQAVEVVPGGPLLGQLELSNGLQVRIGNQLTPCP